MVPGKSSCPDGLEYAMQRGVGAELRAAEVDPHLKEDKWKLRSHKKANLPQNRACLLKSLLPTVYVKKWFKCAISFFENCGRYAFLWHFIFLLTDRIFSPLTDFQRPKHGQKFCLPPFRNPCNFSFEISHCKPVSEQPMRSQNFANTLEKLCTRDLTSVLVTIQSNM